MVSLNGIVHLSPAAKMNFVVKIVKGWEVFNRTGDGDEGGMTDNASCECGRLNSHIRVRVQILAWIMVTVGLVWKRRKGSGDRKDGGDSD